MPIAKPCPDTCTFDWVDFHGKLDTALAHMIDEADSSTPAEDYLPSKALILQLMEFSAAKKRLQEINPRRERLPDHLKPIAEFSLYGVPVQQMTRDDLLRVVQWFSDELENEKKARRFTHG